MALGSYPDVSLADARERREIARKLLASNPGAGGCQSARPLHRGRG